MTDIKAEDVRRQIQDGSQSTGAIDGEMFDRWLDAHDAEVQAAVTKPYEVDAIQRSEDGRTDWDYEQRIAKLERILHEVARREKEAKMPNLALRVLLREGIAPHQEDVRRPGICYWCDAPWPHTEGDKP